MTNPKAMLKPNYVYRAWDSYGLLLYIGCSVNPEKRMSGHNRADWYRYAETVSIVGPWDFAEARRRETEAINTEASYFNVTQAQADEKKRCIGAAKRALYARNDYPPILDVDRYHEERDTYWDEYDVLRSGWDRRKDQMQARLKASTHPYMNEAERRGRYLAARHDAELAHFESLERAA